MTDNEIIKALKCCSKLNYSDNWDICKKECPYAQNCYDEANGVHFLKDLIAFINRQKAEIERLEYTLLGVMHSVDKWLDGGELKQDEVNRAATMREKTLQIVEKLEEENDFLKSIDIDRIKAEAVKEFAERLHEKLYGVPTVYNFHFGHLIDNLVKEFTEGKDNGK